MKDFIYPHSFETAQERGETELFRESAAQNHACLAAIDKAISASNYEPDHYNLSAALESVTKDYSVDRVAYLMAGLIQAHDSDGRYSRTNKAWAQDVEVADTRRIVLNSHPILLDGFTNKVRDAQLQMVMKAPEQIAGIRDISVNTIEVQTAAYVRGALMDAGINGVEVVGAKVYGSRAHENESHEYSDLDVVVEYRGNLREDDLFSMLHEDGGFEIGGVYVDINPITEGKSGTLAEFMLHDHQRRMVFAQDKQFARIAEEKENPLKSAEMSSEQNYNQIDGIINNESPRSNQGYVITDSEIIGNKEIVLAQSPTAPSPFVTWMRNIENDEQDGVENFFWGHYFTNEEPAREDFKLRVTEEREDFLDTHPSIRAQLKENAAQCVKQSAAPKKDLQER